MLFSGKILAQILNGCWKNGRETSVDGVFTDTRVDKHGIAVTVEDKLTYVVVVVALIVVAALHSEERALGGVLGVAEHHDLEVGEVGIGCRNEL